MLNGYDIKVDQTRYETIADVFDTMRQGMTRPDLTLYIIIVLEARFRWQKSTEVLCASIR